MRHAIILPFLLSQPTFADEPVTMTNGMICFRSEATQQVYGCGSGIYMPQGFNEVESGKYYPPLNRRFALDPETSQLIYLPDLEVE